MRDKALRLAKKQTVVTKADVDLLLNSGALERGVVKPKPAPDSVRSDPAPDAAVGPSGSAGDDVSSADPFDEAPESPETAPEPETASKSPRPPKGRQRATRDAEGTDYGKCPNCAGTKWTEDEDGVCCSKCYHPHGEPAGDVDEDRFKTQRSKTVKTGEALIRAFDDLQVMKSNPEYEEAIKLSKLLVKKAREWK